MGALKEPVADPISRSTSDENATSHRPVDLRWRADIDDLVLRGLHGLAAALTVLLTWWAMPPTGWQPHLPEFRCWLLGLPVLSMLRTDGVTRRWTGRKMPPGLQWMATAWRSTWACTLIYGLNASLQLPLPDLTMCMTLWFVPPVLTMLSFGTWTRLRRRWIPRMHVVLAGSPQALIHLKNQAMQQPGLKVIGEVVVPAWSQPVQWPAPPTKKICDGVLIALDDASVSGWQQHAQLWRWHSPNVYLWAAHADIQTALAQPSRRGPAGAWSVGPESLPLAGRLGKRLFDMAFATTALLAFVPFGLLIAAAVQLESPGPVFFVQRRYGRHGTCFPLIKFRSMQHEPQAGEIRLTERGDSRVTRVGEFLRRSSLDEFPQFINVLMGHMSVVGPRPHPPGVKAGQRTYEDVIPDFMARYQVRPGLTGWAQVHGLRGNTFTEEDLLTRFDKDIEYIQRWTWTLDLLIIARTVLGGFGGRNAF